MLIRNSDTWIRPDFQEKEFFTKSPDFRGFSHEVATQCIDGVQYIRDLYKIPMRITSTMRTIQHNKNVGGADSSYHLTGRAVDWQFTTGNILAIRKFKKDYFDQSTGVKAALNRIGVNGVIFYDTFCHFDNRGTVYTEDKTGEKTVLPLVITAIIVLIGLIR